MSSSLRLLRDFCGLWTSETGILNLNLRPKGPNREVSDSRTNMSNTIELDEAEPTRNPTKKLSTAARCRFCKARLRHTFVDLGMSPLCESNLTIEPNPSGRLKELRHRDRFSLTLCHR
jgi:hypothetical protein